MYNVDNDNDDEYVKLETRAVALFYLSFHKVAPQANNPDCHTLQPICNDDDHDDDVMMMTLKMICCICICICI